MIQVTAIDHVVLRTTRLEQMVAFYRDVLGCHVERELPADVGLTQLRAGSALIDLVPVDSKLGRMGGGPPTEKDNNLDHFCLRIQPLAEKCIRQHLERHGVEVGDFSNRYGAEGFGESIYLNDPDGNVVELRSEQGDSRV